MATNKQLDSLIKNINKESNDLKGRGRLDGLHNIARQNVSLAKIYAQLSTDINHLTSTIIKLNKGSEKLNE